MLKTIVMLLMSAGFFSSTAFAIEGPPVDANGVISNPQLRENEAAANLQAVKTISTFMSEGAQECDEEGNNCRSVFGSDDSMDYATLQGSAGKITGVAGYSYMAGDNAANVSTQTGTAAIACGDEKVHTKSGIAIKLTECRVSSDGSARITAQVCTAPVRGNPVEPVENAVECSNDPTAPNFRPPPGMTCYRPSCDSEEVGSLNGWSHPTEITFQANMPETASEAEKSNNGLAMIFYPALGTGITPSFSADSDNMTALKIVQTFVDNETKRGAVGLRIAFRQKTAMTRDKMVNGTGVTNPSEHSAQWDTLLKLQANAEIPKYQEKYAANGTECLTQIHHGVAETGTISVCDRNYTNESGIRPIALEADVIAEGEQCGTSSTTCVNQVVNTNTWTHSCAVDVPMALRNCSTTQDYQIENVSYVRTRNQEICTEKRTSVIYSCQTEATVLDIKASSCPAGTVLVNTFGPNACHYCIDSYQYFKVQCQANNTVNVFWHTATPSGGYYSPIVDRTVTQNPYDNSVINLGPFCDDGSGYMEYRTSCTDTTCHYKVVMIGGNCPGGQLGLTANAVAPINYQPTYGVRNGCSLYESSR